MPTDRQRAIARFVLQWAVALLIVYFLLQRLRADWPTVQPALRDVAWGWIAVAIGAGLGYVAFRVFAWRALLSVGGHLPWWAVARAWMNSEIIRYIPGSIWSFIGRFVRGARLGVAKQTVAVSMFLEILLFVVLAGALGGLLLIGAPLPLNIPSWLVGAAGAVLLIVASPPVLLAGMRKGHRFWHKIPAVGAHGSLTAAGCLLIMAWLLFAAAHLAVLVALGVSLGMGQQLHVMGMVIAAWLAGFLVVIAPSGLGVREAVVMALLAPLLGSPLALLFAVTSRLLITLVELLALVLVNLFGRERKAAV